MCKEGFIHIIERTPRSHPEVGDTFDAEGAAFVVRAGADEGVLHHRLHGVGVRGAAHRRCAAARAFVPVAGQVAAEERAGIRA